jgi:hypothetical protein
METMTTDLMVRLFPENEKFELAILLFADDGFIYAAKSKTFNKPFKANELKNNVADWFTWNYMSFDELTEIKKIRKEVYEKNKQNTA